LLGSVKSSHVPVDVCDKINIDAKQLKDQMVVIANLLKQRRGEDNQSLNSTIAVPPRRESKAGWNEHLPGVRPLAVGNHAPSMTLNVTTAAADLSSNGFKFTFSQPPDRRAINSSHVGTRQRLSLIGRLKQPTEGLVTVNI
jgi:hypothetical protein